MKRPHAEQRYCPSCETVQPLTAFRWLRTMRPRAGYSVRCAACIDARRPTPDQRYYNSHHRIGNQAPFPVRIRGRSPS